MLLAQVKKLMGQAPGLYASKKPSAASYSQESKPCLDGGKIGLVTSIGQSQAYIYNKEMARYNRR